MGFGLKWRAPIIVGFTLVCCLMPALLLWFLGYVDRTQWNDNSIVTMCTIIGQKVKQDTCSESCNCVHVNDRWVCATCEYVCYNGYVLTNYTVDRIVYNKTFEVISGNRNEDSVIEKLQNKYTIGKQIECYYNKNDPTDIRTNHKPTRIFLAFFVVFCILTGLILIIWAGIELYLHFK